MSRGGQIDGVLARDWNLGRIPRFCMYDTHNLERKPDIVHDMGICKPSIGQWRG